MGSPKELLRGALVGFSAWLLCGIATGAALPVSTQHPAIEDDYSTPNFPSTLIFADYFGPTLPTTTEEDLDFPAETPFPFETNGETPKAVGEGEMSSSGEPPNSGLASSEDDSGSLTSTPKTFKIPEDLKETLEVPSVDKSILAQVNSSEPTLGKETLQGDPLAESQEASKETPPPDLDAGHEATELITERYSGITDAPVTVLATLKEDFLASSSREEAQTELASESPPEGDKLLENIPGEPNLEEELKPTSTSWEETEAAPLEAEKDTPEPSTDESRTLEDPSSNSIVFPSTPEDLPDQGTEENVDAGDQPSLSSEGRPETSQSSTGFPPIWPAPTNENFGSAGTNDFDVGSLQPSPASVDSGSPEGRGDTDPIPSSSGPELNHENPVNLTSEEPEDFVDAEAPNSSPSDRTTDAPSDSGPPSDTLVRTSQLDASDIPLMGLSVTPEIPSQLPEDGEVDTTSTVEEEGEVDSGNPKSNEGTSLVSSLPGQESAQGTGEEISADLLSDTASSLNPGVETANSELEDSEATTTSNSVPEDEINPISSDSATVSENESGALFDTTAGSPPPVDNEGADKAQEPPAETQGSPSEASAPASTDGPSSETEGNEVSPSGSPGNIGSSLDEVDTEANSEDGSGSDLSPPGSTNEPSSEREGSEALPSGSSGNMGSSSENSDTIPSVPSDEVDTQANGEDHSVSDLPPPDTELSSISGTPQPMGRSGTLNDQPFSSQSLVENALTSGSNFSSEGEPTFPSTSPDEALSGSLISEPDTTELSSNSLPGSQPSSQLPKENDMEISSGDLEGPPTEASAPGSTNEPSSVREGSEVLPNGSPESSQPSSQLPKENDMETGSGDVEDSPPPPVDNQGAAKAEGPPAEASTPGSTNEPSSEREGSEVLPSGSPGNMGSPSENSDAIPSVSSDEVDTQANGEDRSVSDLPPSDTDLSSISETPLATSSQPPKENDMETHSEVPEDSVSIDGEETSSAPSIINPQSALAEATEEPSISGDLSDGPIISPKEERIGSTSEPGVNEEPLLDGDNTQDKINTPSSEQQLGSEDTLETSIPSSGDEPAVKSGTISPLVDTETSTKTQEPSGETSSASIEGMFSNSENEDGEPSPSLLSKTLDSSPGSEVVDESRDGEDDTGSASSAKTAITVNDDGQPGSDFPVGQLVTSPVGGILALAPIEDGETSVPRDDAQLSTGAVSSEDATPQSASSAEGTETSASEPSAVGSQPSPDDEAAPETSKETEQTSAASEKVSPMASSTAESQEPTTSESGALNKESPAFPVEVAGTAKSPPATDKSSQFLPESVASSDGVEDSEDIINTISEISSQGPLDRGSESKTSTSEEDTEGRSDGELSLNNNGTETATVESANNGGSQLLPDGAQPSTITGTSEISEGPSSVNGQEGSLIPSAAESHSTSTSTEEVENANLESGTQPSLDGSPTTEVQDSKSAEAAEDTSNNGEKLSLTLSATASKSPGISDGEDVSGGTGEELEMTDSGSTNNAGAQPSVVAGGATETSDASNRVEPLESSSANEGDTSLGSSAAESSTAPEDQEISGKPSDGDGMEAVNSEPATNAEPQSSPNGVVGPGGAPASEEAGTSEVSGTRGGSLAASAPESQAISSSNGEETSNTATNAGSQLPLDGESTAESTPPNHAEIAEASSSVPEEKGPLSPSTPESLEDSSSAKEVETASRKSTTDEGSQLSADGTPPEDSLASEGAEPTESHSIASGDKASPVPSATELQLPETSANEKVLGGLENGESSLSPGKEIANAGSSSNNAGSQTSPDSVATEGEEAETSQDNSIVSEKQLSLAPSSTEPQSPGTSVSKDVSENLINGEPALSTDGGKDTANIGTAGAQTPMSSTGTGLNQNNIAEQFGQNSESISGQPSADGAMIAKSPEETLIPSSVSSDGNLATQGTSQDFDALDSSQPSSDIQGNLANSINAGRTEDSLLSVGDHISISDTLGVPEGPISDAKAGGEVLQRVSEPLASVNNLTHPSSAEGTKPAAGQLSGVTSPLAFLPPKNGLLLASSNLGGPKLGNVVGKGSSPSTPEERGEVVNSILAVHKEISTASSADGGQPSLLGAKGSPAKVSKLVPGKPGPQDKVDALLLSSKPEVPASKLTSGKPGLQGKADAPQLSSKPEVPAKASKLTSGKPGLQGKADAPQLSSKPEVPASKLTSGKPGLQGKADAPQLSSKPEVPASKLTSGKPGLQGKADAPQLSSKPEVPEETPQLPSGKPGLQGKADAPQLSSKPEVPASKLTSGKPGRQGKADAPQLSSKPEVPASKLTYGKPGLQGKADAPQLSSKPEVPEETPQLPSGKSEPQLTADTHLLSFNSDVVANSERTLPGKPGSSSSDSTSASDENDRDSSSSSNLSEEHQSFMKGKVALDLSKAKPGGSERGVHLALSGVGLLAVKSSEPTGKTAKKKSDSKKSKDKKTKQDKKHAVITGVPSGAAVSLYPYGASVNDKQYVERKVDFNSPLFKPEIGIPLGKTLRNSLYFTDNGQIVFPASDKDISSYPNPPSGGFNGREEAAMVAVFWDNADFSKGSGTIFYQEYPCGNSAKHPLVQDVEAKIRQYVNSSYRARWLLKVTWDKVQPHPAQRQTSKTNTYQAILTTDGYRTYTLFLYQHGGMQWDYTKLSAPNALIGYTSGDGYFKNDNLMTQTPAEKYRPDGFQGYNTDVRGLWIYKLDSWIRVNYRQRCLDWLGHEKFPSAWNRNLPPCPCSLQQGMSDYRYTTSQKGGENSGLTLLYSSSPNNYGAGVRCLYNQNGQLQEGRQERIWKKSRKNYPNNDEELKLHDWCCNKAGNPLMCKKYDQKRPRISCQGYKPPI